MIHPKKIFMKKALKFIVVFLIYDLITFSVVGQVQKDSFSPYSSS